MPSGGGLGVLCTEMGPESDQPAIAVGLAAADPVLPRQR